MNVTFKQLTYFIALAKARNFGRAAAMVHVTQPALSTQIKEMEARLGTKLVERQPRDVILTPAGQEVLRHAKIMQAQMRDMQDSVRLREGLSAPVTLGVIPTVAPYLLPVALPMLRAQNARLDLRVRESRTDRLLTALSEGQLDAAVIALPSGVPSLLEVPLFEDHFLLAGSKAQISALQSTPDLVRPASLDPDSLLLLEEGHCLSEQALEVCALQRSETRVDLSASSLSTLCRLAGEGFGLTFLPEIALTDEQKAVPKMMLMRFPEPQPARVIGLVRRKSSLGGAWFDDLAKALAKAGATLLAKA